MEERKRSSDRARFTRVFREVEDLGGAVFGSAVFIVCDRKFFVIRVDVKISSCVVLTDVDRVSVSLQRKHSTKLRPMIDIRDFFGDRTKT